MGENEKLAVGVATLLVDKTDGAKQRVADLAERYRDAAKFLDEATGQISDSWVKWLQESKTYLEELRLWRLAVERENKLGVQSCKDALDFLGTAEVKGKMESLKELIGLAERLRVLKECGFLDSLVDTLIKLKP